MPGERRPQRSLEDRSRAPRRGLGDPALAFAPGSRASLVRQWTDAVLGVVTAKDGNILGKSAVFLEGRRIAVRTEQSNLGDLSADANLALARAYDPTAAVSIKNGGGIRAEIGVVDGYTGERLPTAANPLAGKEAGEISQLDVENSLRFDTNGNVTVPGQRVRRLALIDAAGAETDLLVAEGALVGNPERPNRVVTLNFLATGQTASPGLGGDGYPFPAYAENLVDLTKVLADPGLAKLRHPPASELPASAAPSPE